MDMLKATILELINQGAQDPASLIKIKRQLAKTYQQDCPSNVALLKTYHELVKNKRIKPSPTLKNLLITRPVRSLSGIVNISVLTKPYACPGKCIYCPSEKGIPKSYLSGEPAVERAKRLKYSPYQQTKKRIDTLDTTGHSTDKVELRIIGGTWSYYTKTYQDYFIKRCFDAANQKTSKDILTAQRLNEKAKRRIVGLSIETRPDFINKTEIQNLRRLGVTMVELGVQSIYDEVLEKTKRGHNVQATIVATQLLKEAGFKVLYQIMPNLPYTTYQQDLNMFKEIFTHPNFQPDLLKIYPCAILKNTALYQLYQKKVYQPYTEKQLTNLIKEIKQLAPYHIRIQRINRDIPSNLIVAGPTKISNLRQLIQNDMQKENQRCKCIRCREVKERYNQKEKVYLFRKNYKASQGNEITLTFENKKRTKLYSLLRLRINQNNTAYIRELHTYGAQLALQETTPRSPQHKGLGKKLINQAETITKKEYKQNKLSVISSVGTRNYFRQQGYKLKNTYMVKTL